jgi:polyhydroxyalkanoate synthase
MAESGGANLARGLTHMLEDMERGEGRLRPKMTDLDAFRVGESIATTPGKVVYQNELMQLLQYAPSTAEVHERPLLIVPPWINKFYILDLRPANSFIRWAVDQGHTVFLVSWVDPDERYAETRFDDYLLRGPVAALGVIGHATGAEQINAIGYCIGGTLLACALSWLAARGDDRVASATFFTSLLDFSEVGDISVFLDEEQLGLLDRHMARRGYLEGIHMADAFSLLRANELIWSYVVNNYLLGREPPPFDILYWNADSTRMPAAMHGWYLRNMYQRNRLRVPGALSLAGVPIDLGRIRLPAYFLSTREDHIAPWRTTYRGAALLPGPTRFVLAASGHVAGVVNPPAARKYGHWTGGPPAADVDPEAWLEKVARLGRMAGAACWRSRPRPHSRRRRASRPGGCARQLRLGTVARGATPSLTPIPNVTYMTHTSGLLPNRQADARRFNQPSEGRGAAPLLDRRPRQRVRRLAPRHPLL